MQDHVISMPMLQKCTLFSTAHFANLKHASGWQIFQNVTQHTYHRVKKQTNKQAKKKHWFQHEDLTSLLYTYVVARLHSLVNALWTNGQVEISQTIVCVTDKTLLPIPRSYPSLRELCKSLASEILSWYLDSALRNLWDSNFSILKTGNCFQFEQKNF